MIDDLDTHIFEIIFGSRFFLAVIQIFQLHFTKGLAIFFQSLLIPLESLTRIEWTNINTF